MSLFILICNSCASKISIVSKPLQANVYIRNPDTNAEIFLGQTPLEKTSAEIANSLGANNTSGNFIEFTFKKDGYDSISLLVPGSRWNTRNTILNVPLLPTKPIDKSAMHKILQHLLNAQTFINATMFDRAEFEIDKATQLDNALPWPHILLGQIYYMKGDFRNSLKQFEKASNLDPENAESKKMLIVLKDKVVEDGK